jgi:hypothetical protein
VRLDPAEVAFAVLVRPREVADPVANKFHDHRFFRQVMIASTTTIVP